MKILVVSANAFSKIYNNGKTLEAIFREFSPNELCQLFTRPQDSAFTDYEFCNNYYVVSEVDIINRLRGRNTTCGGPLEKKEITYQSDVYNHFKNSKVKHFGMLRDALWGLNLWKTKELKTWMEQQPDAVFLVGGGSKYLHSIGYYISSRLSIPLFLFYTDDYILHPIFKGIANKIRKNALIKDYNRIINYASGCFSIGTLMSKEYGLYFKKDFYPIMNSVPAEDYIPPRQTSPKILSYFGGLHLNRWKMICRIAKCLPTGWELRLFTASAISEEMAVQFRLNNVKVQGCVSGEELKEAMRKSSALIHVESDDPCNRALTHLSVSTKIPEYLMSGRAIIGYGPHEVASMRLLTDNKIGLFIDSSIGTDELEKKLKDLLFCDNLLKDTGLNGYRYAVDNFDLLKNGKKFRSQLEKLLISAI